MTRAIVKLWNTEVGALTLDDGEEYASFEYLSGFLKSGIEISPFTMPLSTRVFRFPTLPKETVKGLPGAFSDSLPDRFGNTVINAWLESQGRKSDSLNAIERLCYTGKRGMGAFEYEPAISTGTANKSDQIKIDELVKLSNEILDSRKKLSVLMPDSNESELLKLVQVGSSAGGARAKALIALNKTTGEMKSGQIYAGEGFEYYLIKFDGVSGNGDHNFTDATGFCNIEYAYYLMAKAVGIDMTESQLFTENGRFHFMTKRFDRSDDGSKIHMLTLGGLRHFDFNAPGANSYEQAAETLIALGLGNITLEELYRRMCFNIVARNQDDHVKNISFLMDKNGKWRLAPAYDLTFSYRPDSIWVGQHQMTMSGKRSGFTLADFTAASTAMRIKPHRAKEILEQVELHTKNFPVYANAAGVPEKTSSFIANQFEYFLT